MAGVQLTSTNVAAALIAAPVEPISATAREDLFGPTAGHRGAMANSRQGFLSLEFSQTTSSSRINMRAFSLNNARS